MIRITRNKTGKIREKLCFEDIEVPHMEVLIGFEMIGIEHTKYGEAYVWFKEPIRVPNFKKFYASRIKSVTDPYLIELIERLLYLNPKPDALGIKKIVEHIILRFSKIEMKESKVKMGEFIATPILKFEEVEAVVKTVINLKSEYSPDREVSVLFKRESELSKGEKISISHRHRSSMAKAKMESVIHTAAEILIEQKELITVNNSRIRSTELVRTEKGVSSLNTISKYMADRTKRVIQEHNSIAPFKSEKAQRMYEKYLQLPKGFSVKWYAESLGTSNSTVIEFKELEKKSLQIGG